MSTVMPTTARVEGDFSIYKGNCGGTRTRLGLFKNICEIHAKSFDSTMALPGKLIPEARGTKKPATFEAPRNTKRKRAKVTSHSDDRMGTYKKKKKEEERDGDGTRKNGDKKKKTRRRNITDIRTLFSPLNSEKKRKEDPDDGKGRVVDLLSSSDEDEEKPKNPIILNYIVKGCPIHIRKNDMVRLKDGKMLNDALVVFYMRYLSKTFRHEILESRILIFDSYFYSKLTEKGFNYSNVESWTKKENNIFEDFSFIFIPINESTHWSLAVISIVGGRFSVLHLDSSKKCHDPNVIGKNLLRYLRCEWKRLCKQGIIEESKTLPETLAKKKKHGKKHGNIKSINVPRQTNGYDCGMFVCAYAQKIFQKLRQQSNENGDAKTCFKNVARLLRAGVEHWFDQTYITTTMRKAINKIIRKLIDKEEKKSNTPKHTKRIKNFSLSDSEDDM